MYFAAMYAYGSDPYCVGITGIRGCMGVVIDYNRMLYAVHVPDLRPQLAPPSFCNWVIGQQPNFNFNGKTAKMYAVLNKDNRKEAHQELKDFSRRLGIKSFKLIRCMQVPSVPNESKEPESIAIAFRYAPKVAFTSSGGFKASTMENADDLEISFKANKDIVWDAAACAPRGGTYLTYLNDPDKAPKSVTGAGWIKVNKQTCNIKTIRT